MEFNEFAFKRDLLANRKKTNLLSGQLGITGDERKIFFFHHLTVHNLNLLNETRKLKESLDIKFVWFQNNQVLVRKAEKEKILSIKSKNDLQNFSKIFGKKKELVDLSVDVEEASTSNNVNSFNCIYFNIRSLRNKLDEISLFLASFKKTIHILILAETWLHESVKTITNIPGYNSIHSVRKDKIGGGVSIFVKDNLIFNSVYENVLDNNNFLIISLPEQKIHICGIYNNPRSDTNMLKCLKW